MTSYNLVSVSFMRYFCPKCKAESDENIGFCIACGYMGGYLPMVYVRTLNPVSLQVRTAQDLMKIKEKTMRLLWGLGQIPMLLPITVGVYGIPFSGKSMFMLNLASHIINEWKQKVLFNSWEENAVSIGKKLRNLELFSNDFLIVDGGMSDDLLPICEEKNIGWVIIDSYSVSRWSIVDLERLKNNGIRTVFSVHTNKDGEMAGKRTLEHYPDIVIEIESLGVKNSVYRHTKNRYDELQKGDIL